MFQNTHLKQALEETLAEALEEVSSSVFDFFSLHRLSDRGENATYTYRHAQT